jgi:putative oxidoreductase
MLITGLRLFSGEGGDFTRPGVGQVATARRCTCRVSISLALAIRVVLVLLFLPFSALDKVLDFRSAVAQAQEAVPNKAAATALILVGLFVEVFMSAGVVSGIADRACAFVLAGYCAVTALVWKQFWRPGDFWSSGDGKARALFWDFWKNLALGAGFLLIVFGTNASSIAQFLAHPTIQSHPYRLTQEHVRPIARLTLGLSLMY